MAKFLAAISHVLPRLVITESLRRAKTTCLRGVEPPIPTIPRLLSATDRIPAVVCRLLGLSIRHWPAPKVSKAPTRRSVMLHIFVLQRPFQTWRLLRKSVSHSVHFITEFRCDLVSFPCKFSVCSNFHNKISQVFIDCSAKGLHEYLGDTSQFRETFFSKRRCGDHCSCFWNMVQINDSTFRTTSQSLKTIQIWTICRQLHFRIRSMRNVQIPRRRSTTSCAVDTSSHTDPSRPGFQRLEVRA